MNNLCQEFRSSEVQEFRHYSDFFLEFWSSDITPFFWSSGVYELHLFALDALWLLSFRSSLLTALAMGY